MGTTNHQESIALLASDGSYNGGCVLSAAKVTTTDATLTVIGRSDTINATEACIIKALVVGKKSDGTAAAGIEKIAVVRRQAAGNVTLVGAVQGTTQTDGVTPVIGLAINTTTQTIDVQVTGIAAQTWIWECKIEKLKV